MSFAVSTFWQVFIILSVLIPAIILSVFALELGAERVEFERGSVKRHVRSVRRSSGRCRPRRRRLYTRSGGVRSNDDTRHHDDHHNNHPADNNDHGTGRRQSPRRNGGRGRPAGTGDAQSIRAPR